MAKFWITQSRYIKQRGQAEAAFVFAAPNAPALIDLPDGVEPTTKGAGAMTPYESPPEKPLPAHAVAPGRAPRTSSDVQSTRLADKR